MPSGNLQPPRLDLGPRFANHGIADWQPPEFGPPYVTRVPLPDADGNDLGGIRLPDLAVPLGTYTGWNLRGPEIGAPDKLARWSGSFVPFAPTEAARRAAGDPRPSLEARYASRADYRERIEAAARELVTDGFLLADDVPEISARAVAFYDRVLAHPEMIRPAPTSSATERALAPLREPRLPCAGRGALPPRNLREHGGVIREIAHRRAVDHQIAREEVEARSARAPRRCPRGTRNRRAPHGGAECHPASTRGFVPLAVSGSSAFVASQVSTKRRGATAAFSCCTRKR